MTVELITRYVRLIVGFALLWAGMYVYNNYGCRKLEGTEMEPEMMRDNFRRINPTVRLPSQLAYEDVIVYSFIVAGSGQRSVGARVMGLPGDTVKLVKGKVYRNGQVVRDTFVGAVNESREDFEEIIVPRDTVFVLCDNRRMFRYTDSRGIGPVGSWAILGKLQ